MSVTSRRPRRPGRLGLLLGGLLLLAGPTAAESGAGSGSPSPSASPSAPSKTPGPPTATQGPSLPLDAATTKVPVAARPRLEIRRGSGDFVSFHASAVVDGSTPVRLRWSPVLPGTAKASWSTQATALGPPFGARAEPQGELASAPAPESWASFDVSLGSGRGGSLPPGPTRYTLTLTARDAQGQPLGEPSLPVTIDYQPPGSGPPQAIQLDSVQLLDWSPKGGVLNGPTGGQYQSYGPDEKVTLSYRIELVTSDDARLRSDLVDAAGKLLHGNYFSFVDLGSTGIHTKESWATVRCDEGNPYYEQAAAGIEWKLFRKSDHAPLGQGTKTFPQPIVWRCPGNDQLTLTGMSPPSGPLLGIETPADAQQPGRSVQLTYQYRLASEPKAVVKQVPLREGHQPVPHEYWTETKVSNGTGTATNRLSVYCQSELQPEVEVKHLQVTLAREGSGEAILQEVVPVDWTFGCKPLVISPNLLQDGTPIRPTGPPRVDPEGTRGLGRDRMERAVPGGASERVRPGAATRRVPPPPAGSDAADEEIRDDGGIRGLRTPR